MKKEIKTELTKEKIIAAALHEFGINGYEAASINAVCERHHLSKGLIYHNFHNKDEIYLICVGRVFHELTAYIKNNIEMEAISSSDNLRAYLSARADFFAENPFFLKIFRETVISPPAHLETQIEELKNTFDSINTEMVRKLTADLKLRLDISEPKLIDAFCRSFDLIDALSQISMKQKETSSPLDILLYGMLER